MYRVSCIGPCLLLADFGRKGGTQTFLIDLPVMILFGALFSLFTDHKNRPVFFLRDPYFWHGVVFTSLFNAAVIYAIINFPDWMWMYFLEDSSNTLPELIYLFIFMYYLPYTLGFYLGRDLKQRSVPTCFALILAMALAEVWLVLHLFDRYAVIGTRAQFLSGTAVSLLGPDNPIGMVMNTCVGLMVLYFIVVVILFKKNKKKTLS
ncbi:MAG: hypothetical protein HQM16_09330 [Deltaproteobacteria bacterium]|nr:hypothetical protein [Deltaproteobacteria bacterium]